jgi:peptidoglycan hydrolase-like protein with peptidoglycan-binding domain
MNYESVVRRLEYELLSESESEWGRESEAEVPGAPLRSAIFANDADLNATARGRLRLGRPQDSPYPTPIQSEGRAVLKVQGALSQLGFPLRHFGEDARFGEETYQAVLAYKSHFNIRTASGYLNGIVGSKTIRHLDRAFPPPSLVAGHGLPGNARPGFAFASDLPQPDPAGICSKNLPDTAGNILAVNGDGGMSPFYCINKKNIHLRFIGTWEEVLPPEQRPVGQRNRPANAPKYDVEFTPYKQAGLTPGVPYPRDFPATSKYGVLYVITSFQQNRNFRLTYTIEESD